MTAKTKIVVKGPAKFGWCMDGDHENCRVETSNTRGRILCGCKCHEKGLMKP